MTPARLGRLTRGHLHQGISASGMVLRIWPTRDPNRWHVGYAGYPVRATEEPVPTSHLATLLEEWGFTAVAWSHWPCPIHATNPDLEMLRRSRARG